MVVAAVEEMGYLPIFDVYFRPQGNGSFTRLEVLLPEIQLNAGDAGSGDRASSGGDVVVEALVKALPTQSWQFRNLVAFVAEHESLIFTHKGVCASSGI